MPENTAFTTYVDGIARQHTRVKFRNHFGLGRGIDAKVIQKDAIAADREKVVRNMLQEQPDTVHVVRFSGTTDEMRTERLESPGDASLGELLTAPEQGLLITGAKAKLFVYASPELIAVTRETFEPPKPPAKPKPKPRRKPAPRPEPKISQRPGRHRR